MKILKSILNYIPLATFIIFVVTDGIFSLTSALIFFSGDTMTVREYIRNSWEKSLRKKGHRADGIPLPYPYNSPCAEGIFDEFYYWDTCFINKGLIFTESHTRKRTLMSCLRWWWTWIM